MARAAESFKPVRASGKDASEVRRGTSTKRGYGHRWRKARRAYLYKHPFCVQCNTAANEVDHIIPHKGDWMLFWDMENWQALCKSCHSRKTLEDGKG